MDSVTSSIFTAPWTTLCEGVCGKKSFCKNVGDKLYGENSLCKRIFFKIKAVVYSAFAWLRSLCFKKEEKLPPTFIDLGYNKIFSDGDPSWWTSIRSYMKIPTFETTFEQCLDLKAKFKPALFLRKDGKFASGAMGKTCKKVVITVHRKLYTLCTGGVNRSQGLWRVAAKQLKPYQIEKPHGAVKAHDNYFSERISDINGKGISLMDFENGDLRSVPRQPRFGKGESVEYFDKRYWLPIIKMGGTVLVAGKAVHAAIHRLQALAKREKLSLSRVHIQPIVTEDPYGTDSRVMLENVENYLRAIHKLKFVMAK